MKLEDTSIWARISRLVVTRPVWVLGLALLLILPPLLALPSMRLSHDTLAELPPETESVRGFEVLSEHFPTGEVAPLILVIEDEDSIWEPANFRALADLSRNLKRLDMVATVRSVAMPTDGERPDVSELEGDAAAAAEFPERLREAANGASRIEDGVAQVRDGLLQIQARLPELDEGLDDAGDGTTALLDGVRALRDGLGELQAGVRELEAGLVEARDGAATLRDEIAVPTDDAIREAWDALSDFTVGVTDPEYQRAAENVGEAYGRITGEHPVTGEPVQAGYGGLAASLDDLATGLDAAVAGTGQLVAGTTQLDQGLAQVEDGLVQLRDGLVEAGPGIARLRDGVSQLVDGTAQLQDGSSQLADGLAAGAIQVEEAGLTDLVLGGDDSPFVLTAGMIEAVPQLREDLGFFVADDDTRTRIFIGLKASPFEQSSIEGVSEIEELTRFSLQGSDLDDATVAATGVSAFFNDVDEAASADFLIVVIAVVLSVFAVLVLLLRALVAPLYMVITVLMSYGAALGVTTIVFQNLLGQKGLAWWLPAFLYVLLVALGADYNIYLMSRVREEAETKETVAAVAEGVRLTGGVITSAGLILAGTFAAMMAAPMTSLQQMGFATTVGILLDTFVVRTFLVPSIATLLGRANWWPSARAQRA